MGKRKKVDIIATTQTRFAHKALASDDDAAPRLPDTAMIRCVGCKSLVSVGKAVLVERGRWACLRCVGERRRAR